VSDKVKVGLIGVGHMGRLHLKKLLASPLADLVGVVEPNADKREGVQREFPIRVVASLPEILFDADAVILASPTATHFTIAKKALSAGLDVLIEKPATESVAQTQELCDLARAHDRILQVGFLERYRLKVTEGLPLPRFISIRRHNDRVGREPMVDIVQDLMVHDLDLLLSIYDEEPSHVQAVAWKTISPTPDIVHAWFEFPSGRRAYLSASRVSPVTERKIDWWSRDGQFTLDLKASDFDALGVQLEDFLTNVAKRRPAKVDGRSALRCQKLLQRVLDACAETSVLTSAPHSSVTLNHEI